jgi:hypothetical protein
MSFRRRLPKREVVAEQMHGKWCHQKLARGVTSYKIETGEEVMKAYDKLSEAAKDLDRGMVDAFFEILDEQAADTTRTTAQCREDMGEMAKEFAEMIDGMSARDLLDVAQRFTGFLRKLEVLNNDTND